MPRKAGPNGRKIRVNVTISPVAIAAGKAGGRPLSVVVEELLLGLDQVRACPACGAVREVSHDGE